MSVINIMKKVQGHVLHDSKKGRKWDSLTAVMKASCDNSSPYNPSTLKMATCSKKYRINREDITYDNGQYYISGHAVTMISAILPALRRSLSIDIISLLLDKAGLPIESPNVDAFISPNFVVLSGSNSVQHDECFVDGLLNASIGNSKENVLLLPKDLFQFVAHSRNAHSSALQVNGDEDYSYYERKLFYNSMYMPDNIKGVIYDPLAGLWWDIFIEYDASEMAFIVCFCLRWDMLFKNTLDNKLTYLILKNEP